ncbi:MAG: hypothetical protein LBI10_12565 [Deltaproteobacteria bacterium]|jgi:hypothetical protein|nr:hypothetical protein [Deltaproteobacteria bacterium]
MTKIEIFSSYQDTGSCPANVSKVVFLDTTIFSNSGSGLDKVRNCFRDGKGPELIRELSDRHQVDYERFGQRVAPLFYYCWEPRICDALKKVLDLTGAKIVLSSDLRFAFNQRDLKDLFKIHGFSEYYVDNIGQVIKNSETTKFFTNKYGARVLHWRAWEILEYLERCPQIKRYVVLDDMNLNPGLGDRFLHVPFDLNDKLVKEAINILQKDS